MKIKKGDFIEIDFVGKIKDKGAIFDLTRESDAKKYNVFNPKAKYQPLVACVGEGFVPRGFDDFLVDKEIGKEYSVELSAEKGFGKKDPKLFKIVHANLFRKHGLRPMVGLPVNFDELVGVVRSVSGGRIVVDFNHPLASRELIYEFKIIQKVNDIKKKVGAVLKRYLPMDLDFEVKDGVVEIFDEKLKVVAINLANDLKRVIPEIKEVIFRKKTTEKAIKENK